MPPLLMSYITKHRNFMFCCVAFYTIINQSLSIVVDDFGSSLSGRLPTRAVHGLTEYGGVIPAVLCTEFGAVVAGESSVRLTQVGGFTSVHVPLAHTRHLRPDHFRGVTAPDDLTRDLTVVVPFDPHIRLGADEVEGVVVEAFSTPVRGDRAVCDVREGHVGASHVRGRAALLQASGGGFGQS